jgi:putative sigma-54 modulation protein
VNFANVMTKRQTMNILVRGINLKISEAFTNYAESRARAALKHAANRITHVEIRVGDTNGPRGGIDINAWILAVLAHGGSIVVEVAAPDAYAAVDRAVTRLAGRMQRHVGRLRAASLVHVDGARPRFT